MVLERLPQRSIPPQGQPPNEVQRSLHTQLLPRKRRRVSCFAKPDTSALEVTLLDYGAGNVRSVRNALRSLGYTIKEVI